MASLLCAMTLGATAQTTIFKWSYDGSTTAAGESISVTGGTVTLRTTDTSKAFSMESAAYSAEVTDADLKVASTGLKFGANALYLEIALATPLAAGDVIYVSGYNSIAFSSEYQKNASAYNISTGVTTGNDKNSHNVGQVTVPTTSAGATTLYVMRGVSSSTVVSNIKIVRPADATKLDVEMSFPQGSYKVALGETFEAPVVTVSPEKTVSYSSSDESVATVDAETGEVTPVDYGTTTITATFDGDDEYNSATAEYTLTVYNPALLIDYPNTQEGLTFSGTTVIDAVKIHSNKDAISGYKLNNGYTTNGEVNDNYVKMEVVGGFKKGDIVTIAGAYNNSAEKTSSAVLFTINDDNTPHTVYDGFSQFINGRQVNDEPVEENYTLDKDYDVLYLGRNGNTATYLTTIRVERPATAEEETITVTISESTYATFYYENKAFEIPEGVTASAVVKEGNSLTEIPVEGVIPAGCPVLLSGAQGEYEFVESAEAGNLPTANSLVGSEEGGKYDEAGYKYYVLCWKDKNKSAVGFYFLSGSKGAYATVKAHQAFLRVENAEASANGYALGFDETTGISTVEAAAADLSAPVYNLAGQRVNGSYKGVVIQNGVKRVNK